MAVLGETYKVFVSTYGNKDGEIVYSTGYEKHILILSSDDEGNILKLIQLKLSKVFFIKWFQLWILKKAINPKNIRP